jgi:hemerythrin
MLDKLRFPAVFALLIAAVIGAFVEAGLSAFTPWLLLACVLVLAATQTRGGKCETFLVWQDNFSVGILEMDEDHKKMLNLINNLRAAILCNTGEDFERYNLQELMAYTRGHLSREEALMSKHGYPDFEGHKAQHDQMISYVETFCRRYEKDGSKVLSEIVPYLTLWLTDHINVTDKKYSAFLQERGVS